MSEKRDISEYTQTYMSHEFEDVMVSYRRKKVLEILNFYKPNDILEIGCGLNSIVNYYNKCKNFVIVEPSESFAKKAVQDISKLIIPPPMLQNALFTMIL